MQQWYGLEKVQIRNYKIRKGTKSSNKMGTRATKIDLQKPKG